MCCSSCGRGSCVSCKIMAIIVALLFALTSIASFAGLYRTHVTPAGFNFGTPEGSLAILAFVLSVGVCFKLLKHLCPCPKVCADCGKAPCGCKE